MPRRSESRQGKAQRSFVLRPATPLHRPFPKEITDTAGQGGQGSGQGNGQGKKRGFLRLVRVVKAYTIKLL